MISPRHPSESWDPASLLFGERFWSGAKSLGPSFRRDDGLETLISTGVAQGHRLRRVHHVHVHVVQHPQGTHHDDGDDQYREHTDR